MTDADVNMIIESYSDNDDYFSEAKYNKPMMIRLDAESKKKQLYALAINVWQLQITILTIESLRKFLDLERFLELNSIRNIMVRQLRE